jgi:hypothetical protein
VRSRAFDIEPEKQCAGQLPAKEASDETDKKQEFHDEMVREQNALPGNGLLICLSTQPLCSSIEP